MGSVRSLFSFLSIEARNYESSFHDDVMVEQLSADPAYTVELLEAVQTSESDDELAILLRQLTKATAAAEFQQSDREDS